MSNCVGIKCPIALEKPAPCFATTVYTARRVLIKRAARVAVSEPRCPGQGFRTTHPDPAKLAVTGRNLAGFGLVWSSQNFEFQFL